MLLITTPMNTKSVPRYSHFDLNPFPVLVNFSIKFAPFFPRKLTVTHTTSSLISRYTNNSVKYKSIFNPINLNPNKNKKSTFTYLISTLT